MYARNMMLRFHSAICLTRLTQRQSSQMHMPPAKTTNHILKAEVSPAERHQQLQKRLATTQWPVKPEMFPTGTALVGGAVRDALLGRIGTCPDLDLVLPSDVLKLTQRLAGQLGGTCVVLDAERNMARLVLRGWTIDLARQEGSSLEEDLERRDFRINAMAWPLHTDEGLCDPTGGLQDLRDGRLSAVSEANLIADPLRLLRGIRLMAEIPLELDQTTVHWIKAHRSALGSAAPERILSELQRLVNGAWAETAIERLKQLGLLKPWESGTRTFPTTKPSRLTPEEKALALPLARLIDLLSDEGLANLRGSRRLRQRCERLRSWRERAGRDPDALPESERLQLHQELEQDLPTLILALPDTHQEDWLRRWRDPQDSLFHPIAPVDGTTLQQEVGIRPGPDLGRLLKHLQQERAFGRINGHDEAIREAQRFVSHGGSSL